MDFFPARCGQKSKGKDDLDTILTGDWKVPRTRRQECLRYVAQAFQPASSGDLPVARFIGLALKFKNSVTMYPKGKTRQDFIAFS
jgi:hypothetical protein